LNILNPVGFINAKVLGYAIERNYKSRD